MGTLPVCEECLLSPEAVSAAAPAKSKTVCFRTVCGMEARQSDLLITLLLLDYTLRFGVPTQTGSGAFLFSAGADRTDPAL